MRTCAIALAVLVTVLMCGRAHVHAQTQSCSAVPGHYSVDMTEFHADMFITSSNPQRYFLVVQDVVALTRATSHGLLCSSSSAAALVGTFSGHAWVSDFSWDLASAQLSVVKLSGSESGTLVIVDNTQTVNWLALSENRPPPGPEPVSVLFDSSCGANTLNVNNYMTILGSENPSAYFIMLLSNGQVVIQEGTDPLHAGAIVWRSTSKIYPPSDVYYLRGSYDGKIAVFAGAAISGNTDYVLNSFGPSTSQHFLAGGLLPVWDGTSMGQPKLVLVDSMICTTEVWNSMQAINFHDGVIGIPSGLCTVYDNAQSCSIDITMHVDGTGTGIDHCSNEFEFQLNSTLIEHVGAVNSKHWTSISPAYPPRGLRYASYSIIGSVGSLTFTRYDDNDNSAQLLAVC